jgi:hypothetical protein
MPTKFFGSRSVGGLLLVVSLLFAHGCGRSAPSKTPDPLLPEYSPEAASIFDDVLAPAVFGFDPEGRLLAKDPKLRERVRTSDFVFAARVETVSRVGGVAHTGAYELTLAPSGPPLLGEFDGKPLVVRVDVNSPSYLWIEGAGAGWVGSRLIAFVRRYSAPGTADGVALHFRCEPDTAEVRAVIARDAGLRYITRR